MNNIIYIPDNIMYRGLWRYGSGHMARQNNRIFLRLTGNIVLRPTSSEYKILHPIVNYSIKF